MEAATQEMRQLRNRTEKHLRRARQIFYSFASMAIRKKVGELRDIPMKEASEKMIAYGLYSKTSDPRTIRISILRHMFRQDVRRGAFIPHGQLFPGFGDWCWLLRWDGYKAWSYPDTYRDQDKSRVH